MSILIVCRSGNKVTKINKSWFSQRLDDFGFGLNIPYINTHKLTVDATKPFEIFIENATDFTYFSYLSCYEFHPSKIVEPHHSVNLLKIQLLVPIEIPIVLRRMYSQIGCSDLRQITLKVDFE